MGMNERGAASGHPQGPHGNAWKEKNADIWKRCMGMNGRGLQVDTRKGRMGMHGKKKCGDLEEMHRNESRGMGTTRKTA
eukprot:300571-Chlamydomonas_euryale.AAC.4